MAKLFLFLCIVVIGCQVANEVDRKMWTIPSSPHYKLYPIIYNDIVILASDCNGDNCLKAINKYNGEVEWQWVADDILSGAYYNLTPYVFSEILLLPIKEHLIAIDLRSGKIRWQDSKAFSGEPYLDGIGYHAVRSYFNQKNKKHLIYLIDITNGSMKVIKEINQPVEANSYVRTPHIFKLNERPNDTFLVSSTIEYIPNKQTNSYLSFWSLSHPTSTQDLSIYKPNSKGYGVTKQCITDHPFSYWVANNELVCIDLSQRKEVWRTKMKRGMLTSRLSQDERRLYYASEDEVLYAIDKQDGSITWEVPIAGTPSRLSIDDKLLYLIGGSDGNLYVINSADGQIISKQRISRHNIEKQHFLRRTFIAEDNLLILNDGKNWKCIPLESDTKLAL